MNKFGSLSDYGIRQQLQHHISFSHNSQATFLSIEKLMLNRGIWGENYSDNSSSTSQQFECDSIWFQRRICTNETCWFSPNVFMDEENRWRKREITKYSLFYSVFSFENHYFHVFFNSLNILFNTNINTILFMTLY